MGVGGLKEMDGRKARKVLNIHFCHPELVEGRQRVDVTFLNLHAKCLAPTAAFAGQASSA